MEQKCITALQGVSKRLYFPNDFGKKRSLTMGGFGSGRHRQYNAKNTTDNYRVIDIRRWRRDGLLELGSSFSCKWILEGETVSSMKVSVEVDRLVLSYCYKLSDNEPKNMHYQILIDWTLCNFGGERPWFFCPVKGCHKRVAILYGGAVFACRNCYDLVYSSQRENLLDRITRKADKIRHKLNWEPGILNGAELKPKGMHWITFNLLRAKHEDLVGFLLLEASLRFGAPVLY